MKKLIYFLNIMMRLTILGYIIFCALTNYSNKFISLFIAFILTWIGFILENRFHLKINYTTKFLLGLIPFLALFLGENLDFYQILPWWDLILHTISGFAFALLGISIIEKLSYYKNGNLQTIIFSFSLSMTLSVIWEIAEFIVDQLLGTNTQRWLIWNTHIINGNAGLVDTMTDLMAGCIGATIMSILTFIILYKKRKT